MPKTLTNLDLDLVRTFVTIAGTGNFTRAAEILRRQQSTISLQVQRLENALGQKLIERTPRSVKQGPKGTLGSPGSHAAPRWNALNVGELRRLGIFPPEAP